MPASESAYGGSSGNLFRLRVESSTLSQEIGNNRSRVRIRAYMKRNGSDPYGNWNGYGSPGWTEYNGGNRANHSISTWGTGNGPWYLVSARDVWVGHNTDGTKTVNIKAYHNADTGYVTTATTSHNYTLPTIPRYANITSWSLNTVTEKSIRVSVNTDRTCDILDYSLNGGSWTRGHTGAFTSRSFTISNLKPATAYSVRIRVRNDASNLYTTSGLKSATTNTVSISSLTIPSATDTTLSIRAVTTHVADRLEYRVQGGATWQVSTGDFTTKTVVLSDLTADQSYTVEVRARHKDSGTYTATRTATGETEFPQPLQATNLAPSNGTAVDSLEPTLSWQYNATSADTQGAYQILIRRESDAVTVWDSGKIVSSSESTAVPGTAGLAYNEPYQWQVKTWSGTDIEGTYSDLALFKASEKPTVSITNPTNEDDLNNAVVPISWNYADAESTSQDGYRILIEELTDIGDTSGSEIYDETFSGSDETHLLSPDVLENGGIYRLRVYVKDGDGIWSDSDAVNFTITFVGPTAPTIDVELSEDKLFAQVSVGTSESAVDSYDVRGIQVFKRKKGEQSWNHIGEVFVPYATIHEFEDLNDWTLGGVATGVLASTNARLGVLSMSIPTSGSGLATYEKATSASSVGDTVKVWVYIEDTASISSMTFRLGQSSSDYYSFTVNSADLNSGSWTAIEVPTDDLVATGSPTLAGVTWTEIRVSANQALGLGDLLVDSWRFTSRSSSTYIYDYELANGATYEYSAEAYSENNLPSARTIYTELDTIKYTPFVNTFIIPYYSQSDSVVAFMDIKDRPTLSTNTPTEYHLPVGATKPIVYRSAVNQYRTGYFTVQFYDECFEGEGIDGVHKFEEIMNLKPIMIRTYWGEIYYISIDGRLNITRMENVGWSVSFNFTEIEV